MNNKKTLPPELRVRLARMAAKAWLQELEDPAIARAWADGELNDAPSIPEVVEDLDRLYDAAAAIAEERREKLTRLREALLTNDDGTALRLAAQLCGLAEVNAAFTHVQAY